MQQITPTIAAQDIICVDVVAPPTGMSLPFVSAGGTALILMALATALIVSTTAYHQPTLPEGSL